jgi:integral membrane sensor domain MASE1
LSDPSETPLPRLTVWQVVLFGLAYLAGAEAAHFLAFPPATYWPFWPPAGLTLGVLLVSDRRSWPAICAATFAGSLISDVGIHRDYVPGALWDWAANTVEPFFGAWLFRRFVGERLDLVKSRHLLWLVVVGAGIAPVPGAFLAGVKNWLGEPGGQFGEDWLKWWIGDAIGVLLVAPVVIAWCGGNESPRIRRRTWAYSVEFALYCVVLLLVGEQVFHRLPDETSAAVRYPYFLLTPLLLWAGLRFEPRCASLTVLLLGVMVTWYTARGYGAIARFGDPVTRQGLLLQALLAQASCLTLLFSGSIERRELAEERLREESEALSRAEVEARRQNNLLQSIFDSIGEALIVVDAAGNFVHFNPAAQRMHAQGPEPIPLAEWPRTYSVYLADGVTPCPADQLPTTRALRGESCDGVPLVIRAAGDSPPVHARVTARPIFAADASIAGAVVVRSDVTALVRAERDQADLIAELQRALHEIKTLRGLIPVCSHCKKIRNDMGAWERFEAYLSAHTEAEFTHGFCPDCSEKLYGNLQWSTPEIPALHHAAAVTRAPKSDL